MSTQEAIALYRAEKVAAIARGVNVNYPKPIPGRFRTRHCAINMHSGHAWLRKDAFVISLPRS